MLLVERTVCGLNGRPKRVFTLRCDQCGVEFEKPGNYNVHKRHHICSRQCLNDAHGVNGILRPIMVQTMQQKMGDDWASQIGRKISAASTPAQFKARAQKAKQTVIERYGANSACQIPHVRQSCLTKGSSPEAIAKRKATNVERFGVESTLSLPEVHALANTPEKCQQRHETMKRNGSYFNSKQEHTFNDWLVSRFGATDVERQVVINTWPIDFYVKSIDTYVQFDGEYWHGLDRPLEQIMQFKTPRDRTIFRKYHIDREQDVWFTAFGKRLIRITNQQFARGDIPDELK